MLMSLANAHHASSCFRILGSNFLKKSSRISPSTLCCSAPTGIRYSSRKANHDIILSSALQKPALSTFNTDLDTSSINEANILPRVQKSPKKTIKDGPGLEYFLANGVSNLTEKAYTKRELEKLSHPYVQVDDVGGHGRKVYFEVYGCQMNVNDTEVVWSILKEYGYCKTSNITAADVVLVMTCSIREGAEKKIWNLLNHLRGLKRRRSENNNLFPLKIGILGCMAERLKKKLVEKEKCIDVVAGPDSYRDLPRLLALVTEGEAAVNVLLSLEETYADVVPLSLTTNRTSAFVSIMRGCDNMCTYCIVPFTRGRERSRDINSILEEVRFLSGQGIKEVTLLGQNVNSYRDTSSVDYSVGLPENEPTHTSRGFKTVYKPKKGGLRFVDLLEKVSEVDPEMRIRFTSPHPKDFPDEVLFLIHERNNICSNLHLPAQSGNNRVLDLMRRGYTREAYCELVANIRSVIPGVSLSSDFICGFCTETEAEFEETLSLIEEIKYNLCYLFAYSVREKTPAHRKYVDDVPRDEKIKRLQRMAKSYRRNADEINKKQIGQQQLVLVEGKSKKSNLQLAGRNDGNTKVIIPNVEVEEMCGGSLRPLKPGDYVSVVITEANSQVLKGVPTKISSIKDFFGSKPYPSHEHNLRLNIPS